MFVQQVSVQVYMSPKVVGRPPLASLIHIGFSIQIRYYNSVIFLTWYSRRASLFPPRPPNFNVDGVGCKAQSKK